VAPATAVALVVSAGSSVVPLAVDIVTSVDNNDTVTTTAFSTTAPGELLVAFAASDGPTASAQSLTISGAGLTWNLVRRSNTQFGTAEIWSATAPAALTDVTVTSTQLAGGFDQTLTVVAFTGSGGTGASAAANGATGTPTLPLTTTRAGSLIYGVGNDWDRAAAHLVGPSRRWFTNGWTPASAIRSGSRRVPRRWPRRAL